MLVAEVGVRSPTQLYIIASSIQCHDSIPHTFRIYRFAILAQPYCFTHLIRICTPYLSTCLGIKTRKIAIGSCDKHLAISSHRPYASRRQLRIALAIVPLPHQRTIGQVQRVEVRIPSAKIEFILIHQRTRQNIVFQLIKRPFHFARMDINRKHSSITTADIGNAFVDSSSTHNCLICCHMPQLFARLGIQAIDIIVRTTEHHYPITHRRTSNYAHTRIKSPICSASLLIDRVHHTHIITHKQTLSIGHWRRIDTSTQALMPNTFYLLICFVHREIWTQTRIRCPIFLLTKRQTQPLLHRLPNTFLMKTNTIRHRDYRIAIDRVIATHIRAIEHISYTVAVKHQITMIVTAHHALHIVLAQHIRHIIPVVHIAIFQRIMSKHKYRSLPCLGHTIQIMLEPCDILRSHMPIRHANHWPRIEAYKIHPIMAKCKTTIAKHTTKIHHTRLRPCSLMIARSRIEWHMQLLQCCFDGFYRSAVARLRQVARHNHKFNLWILVNICNRTLQIFHRTWITRADMRIGQQRKRE